MVFVFISYNIISAYFFISISRLSSLWSEKSWSCGENVCDNCLFKEQQMSLESDTTLCDFSQESNLGNSKELLRWKISTANHSNSTYAEEDALLSTGNGDLFY